MQWLVQVVVRCYFEGTTLTGLNMATRFEKYLQFCM